MNIVKPTDINKIWAASGDVLAPSDTKISQGWGIEIPPRQYFNYIDGKQDQAVAHINQHGIAVWDSSTEYQANLSYSQGSDGKIYKCLVTNTNINPVGDTTNTWRVAFLDSTAATGPVVATATQARAQTDNSTFISPLQLANAFTGTKQNQGASTGYQVFPGGMILQAGVASLAAVQTNNVNFPIAFPNKCISVVATAMNSTNGQDTVELNGVPTTANFNAVLVSSLSGGGGTTGPSGPAAGNIYYMAFGY